MNVALGRCSEFDSHSCALLIGALLVAAVTGCSSGSEAACKDLFEAGDYVRAANRCAGEYEETESPTAGLAATVSSYELGRDDDVLEWTDRLGGTTVEAEVLGYAASVHRRQGRPELGLELSQQKIALHRAANEYEYAAGTHYTLFMNAWERSRFRDAVAFLRETHADGLRAGNEYMQALAVQGLVSVLLSIGDVGGARYALERAEALVPTDDHESRAYLKEYRGIIEIAEGRSLLARGAFEEALKLAEGTEDTAWLRSVHLNLAEINASLGATEDATRQLEAAQVLPDVSDAAEIALLRYRALIEHARGDYDAAASTIRAALARGPAPDSEWELETQLGDAEAALGDLQAAEAAYERAISHIESMRQSLGLDNLKAWLIDEKRRPYERLFGLLAAAGRAEEALATIERAKARAFLDAAVRATSEPVADVLDLWANENALQRFDTLMALQPVLSQSTAVSPLDVGELLGGMSRRNLAVYFQAGEAMWAVSAKQGELQLHQLAGTPVSLEALVHTFVASPDDSRTAAQLGALLMPPGLLPERGSELHLVVDGALGQLPFAALIVAGRPLVQDYVITYVPSVSALAVIDDNSTDEVDIPVVLGDPWGDLAQAAAESRDVARWLGVKPALGSAATFEKLVGSARSGILHLATHTGLGPRGPWLALAAREVDSGLLVAERIGPRIVVLATCASGAREGKGMWGSLGAAFLASGSQAVLASLWSIEDELAREFANLLYTGDVGESSAAALTRVQRAFIAAGRPPSDWATFVHFGSARVLRLDP